MDRLCVYDWLDRFLRFKSVPSQVWKMSVILIALMLLFSVYEFHNEHKLSWPIFASLNPVSTQSSPFRIHPVLELVTKAEDEFRQLQSRQSKDLGAAVYEYKRRYKMPPPPHFDEWYAFATERGTELIDEFDTIHNALLPFWALSPATIRERTRQILGGETNYLMGASIRTGQVRIVGEGQSTQANGTAEMLGKFAHKLPDMDLAFNVHDEPRVIVPYERLKNLLNQSQEAIKSIDPVMTKFSRPPPDLGPGESYAPSPNIYFMQIGRRPSWSHTRLSCPPFTPAGDPNLDRLDDNSTFSVSTLGFVSNFASFSDICLTPSVSEAFDPFNSYQVSHELVPIFSTSKLSSFHDIPYPSTWYYTKRVHFDEESSVSWDEKKPKLYWRGSTSSGWSEKGEWRNHLRQNVIIRLHDRSPVTVLQKHETSEMPDNSTTSTHATVLWTTRKGSGKGFRSRIDAHFTEIKQCSPEDCKAQTSLFDVKKPSPQAEAWKFRYLLDMDGNAFSGRFYAFLRSHSLPMKLAYFREWHSFEWVRAWVHFVPVSRAVQELPELLRYFEEEDEGREIAKRLAGNGRKRANEGGGLRKEDMEVWMFRLLLEYGRIVDDERGRLGYIE